jgi:pimeloyl-ACP methyl ester carboxylesterase
LSAVRASSSRRVALVALLLAVVVPLSGCTSWYLPPHATSAPTNEKVAADLEPFYQQVLSWASCGNNLQCADAKAPLDWASPSTGSIKLALVRQPATSGHAKGSLLVNPGGPGGSGYDFIKESVDYATSARLQAQFDIVGFDPRGVNRSSAVKCYENPKDLDAYIYDIPKGEPGSDAWITELEKSSQDFGAACLKYTGALLGHVDTISAARDLDLLRAVLGDKKLNYLGYSYGTLLGATYAELYPKNTGRLVLDGALDPTVSPFELSVTQAKGFEHALRAFLAQCPTLKGCPFGKDVDAAMKTVRAILDGLDASPLRAKDGRELGSGAMFAAIIYPLYSVDNWPYLVSLFSSVMHGDPEIAFVLADGYNDRNKDGSYTTNSTEAFTAVNCLDYPSDANVATIRAEAVKLEQAAPVFGHVMAYGGTECFNWPFAPTRTAGEITAAGSAPIIVVGTTGDPATPYPWAQHLAAMLQEGHLVTYKGEGHTAYNKSNSCVNDAVDDYFIDGTVPKADPEC